MPLDESRYPINVQLRDSMPIEAVMHGVVVGVNPATSALVDVCWNVASHTPAVRLGSLHVGESAVCAV